MELKCVNKKCFHSWNYKGTITDGDKLISCPKCHYRNPLKKLQLTHSLTEKESNSLTHSQENSYRKVLVKPQTDFVEVKNSGERKSMSELGVKVDDFIEIPSPEFIVDKLGRPWIFPKGIKK